MNILVAQLLILTGDTEVNLGTDKVKRHKTSHEKPPWPAVKPTLRDLSIIPLLESQWYTLGQALGLQESLLHSIQMGTSNPTRRKREMFKSWLEVKGESVSWQTLLSALREIAAADVVEMVQKEYEILSGSDSEEVLSDQDEMDAGFVEDVGVAKATAIGERSTVQRKLLDKQPEHEEPPLPPEYMAFEYYYKQLLSLVTEHPDDFAIRAFARAMIDTSKLDDIQSSLITDHEKATKLLREIGRMIHTSVPQAFERLLQILDPESDSAVVRELINMTEVYKILTELKKSSAGELNLDVLAEKLLYKGLITQETYKECTWTEENQTQSKTNILFNQVSKQGASQAFLSIMEAYPNTRDLADTLRLDSDGSSTSASSEHSMSVVDSSGYQTTDTVLTDETRSNTEPTQSEADVTLMESAIGSVYSSDLIHSPVSSTSSDQFHSLDSGGTTMVSGTFTNEALSESTLPSLERRSSPPVSRTSLDTTTLSDTLSPHTSILGERTLSEKYSPSPFSFQAEAPLLWEDPSERFLAAIARNDVSVGDAILRKQETHVDSLIKDGGTALHMAAISGYHEMVKVLLDHKASVNIRDHHGNTPLHLAANYGNYEVVKLLVGAFADVDAVTKDGTPMLLPPSSKGYSMVTEYLLENGAKPNHANQLGVTPLIAAARRGKKDVVRVLLQHGADVNAVSLETSRSALEEAVHGEHTEIVTMLIKAKSKADDRSRALFTCKSVEMVQKLVREGVKVDDKRGDGATPLIVHTELGNSEVVKVLIELNANVDLQDEAGFSALMKAAQSGNLEIVLLLVAAEAILDLKSKQGLTALMYAVKNQNVPVAKELLVAGADRNARDKGGKTVAELAEEQGCEEVVELFQRQALISDTSDPFVQLLSTYFVKAGDSKASSELSSSNHESSPALSSTHSKQHLGPQTEPSAIPISHHPLPKPPSDDDSTLKDQLQKSWKRIADLETRIHDLTLQATMETPEASDLSYLDRGRLEEEFQKLKELKKKAERYAVEAKQTAQRLSAENFKLKEDLSRERHHNELTRKNMIREMEQKLDKSATALDRVDARLEVFEQEVNERALQMIRRMPKSSLAIQLPGHSITLEAPFMKELILKQKIRSNFVLVGIVGLPFSGKSTLLSHLLELKRSQEEHARIDLPGGLSVYEAVIMKDKINDECNWINSTKYDAEALAIGVALAHVYAKSHQFPSFTGSSDFLIETMRGVQIFKDPEVNSCFHASCERLIRMMKWVVQHGKLEKLMTASLTFVNIWDMGVNKAVFEVLTILSSQFKNLRLLNVLNLKDAQGDRLYQPPDLKVGSRYGGRYSNRGDDEMLMRLHSILKYYVQIVVPTVRAPRSTLLVGTFADQLDEAELKMTRTRVVQSVKGRAEAVGVAEAICPEMLTINAQDRDQVLKVREVLEGMIEKGGFDLDVNLSWIFLRCVLFSTKKLFMSRTEVLMVAKKCGLESEEELEEFLKLYLSCGSIIYSPSDQFPKLHEYIILNPIAFIEGLDRLYYADKDTSMPDKLKTDVESTRNGFLSHALARHLWKEHKENCNFYLQVLQTLGLIVQVDEILRQPPATGKMFFMPSLRPVHDPTMPNADSNSLIVTYNIDALPYHKQSNFIVYLMALYKDRIKFVPDHHYNVIRFQWSDPVATTFVRFRGEFVEIGVEMDENQSAHQRATLCSILKTACIEIFNNTVQELPGLNYDLAIVCPESKQPQKRLHFIPFHAMQYSSYHLFCPNCKCHIEDGDIHPNRKLWVQAAYQGVAREVLQPEDFLSSGEMGEIVDRLSQQPFERVQCFAHKLGFTKREVTEKSQHSSVRDLLFFLLLEWKRRNPTNTTQSLALVLMSCGHYTEALRLDPTLPESSRPLSPDSLQLTTTELGFVAQSVAQKWVELARVLRLQENDIREVQKTYRTHGEQSFQMLELWLRSNQQSPDVHVILSEALQSIGYFHLADFIETRTLNAVLQ